MTIFKSCIGELIVLLNPLESVAAINFVVD